MTRLARPMSSNPPTDPTASDGPPIAESVSALRYQASSSAEPWRPEATAIVVGAAAASVFGLGLWGGVLWRFLQPAAFQGRIAFWPTVPVGLAVLFLGGLFHVTVVAGAAAMFARSAAARLLLLLGGAGVLALHVFHLVASSWPRPAVTASDLFFGASAAGVQLLSMALPHALLLFVVTRRAARRMLLAGKDASIAEAGDAWPIEAKAIVLAVSVNALCLLAQSGVSVWFANSGPLLRPSQFAQSIRYWLILLAYTGVYATLLAGGAVALLRRRARPARLLVAGAAGWAALRFYGFAASWWFPPSDFPRYRGAELVVNVTYAIFQTGTLAVIYALTLYVATRTYAKSSARFA